MKQEIRDKLPTWYEDLSEWDAVITGDIDSLLGYYFIKKKFPNVGVKGFYNFNEYYNTGSNKKSFGIDLDIARGATFGNHMVWYSNKDAINLNNLYNYKYYKKYPLNTVLLILSLYDFDLESFTDEQLKIILAIDSAYKGYYASNQHYIDVYTTWLDRLDIRFLEDRILKNMTVEDFKAIQMKYNLSGIMQMGLDGKLYTNINLGGLSLAFNDMIELPRNLFTLKNTYEYIVINPLKESVPDKDKILSMAWTHKNTLKMSLKTGV